jgi:NADP-dependent 3-hydroxy acid dehydrogenase YdfG
MSQVWMITGCSTGFGHLLSEAAFQRGDSVVATARSLDKLADLGTEDESRILRLRLDVREPLDINTAVKKAMEKFGKIDVLVNNAGYGYFATQEEGQLDEIRAMYETNVFGLIAMTQGVLPHFRERGSGTVVNLSSISGRITTPRGGLYQSSKWAVEALSEALHLEVSSFGLRVIVIEPGLYGTDFGSRSARRAPADDRADSPYAALREIWKQNARSEIYQEVQEPREVVDAILKVVDGDQSFLRVPCGKDATSTIARRAEMGEAAFVEWMRDLYHREQKRVAGKR